MATNDFLPFAVGGSANVVSQSAYAALAAVTNGYQSGVANSGQMNKTFRQSSIMAAVLGQFIANTTGQNATDDGTTATLLTNLLAAVKASSNAIVGTVRNLAMSVTAASATATLTADEIIVESALGGLTYKLASFSKSINLATTGAGGMDTGTAPVSGFVALYAIYNPSTGTSALLATNATSAVQPSVYGGANMPSGYTASALVSVVPTNASSQFAPVMVVDRAVNIGTAAVITNSTTIVSNQTLALSVVPKNAKTVTGGLSCSSSALSTMSLVVWGSDVAVGGYAVQGGYGANVISNAPFVRVPMLNTPQQIRYSSSNTNGTPSFSINVTAYEI
jgi:hypothetical protein